LKNHIAVKFLAVFLAALSLFAAIGSGTCIIGLTGMDLYEQSVDDLMEEKFHNNRQSLAVHLLHQYASLKLGNIPEAYFQDYGDYHWVYDNFRYGSYFYEIRDEKRNLVESTLEDMPEGAQYTEHVHTVTELNYRCLLGIVDRFRGESESDTADATTFQAEEPTEAPAPNTDPTNATVPQPFETEVTVPPVTVPMTAMNSDGTVTEASGTIRILSEDDIYTASYFDPEQQDWVDFTFYYSELPPYTVTLYLLPDAVTEEPVWDILQQIWIYRYEMFYVLGISLLLFAICAVYLCCAAGKKPGREEIRPGGFNCIPLDLYAAAGGTGICLIIILGLEVAEYLVRYSPEILLPFIVFAGFGCCLILVGFCFACAAQFKTPGGYWYRRSFCGLCIRGLIALWNRSLDILAAFFKAAGPIFKKIIGKLWIWAKALFRWLLDCAIALWNFTKKLLAILWTKMKQGACWCGKAFNRFFSLLPLTWQWLLTGFVLILIIAICFRSYSPMAWLIGIFLTVVIVIYGSHAFGILMESTKKMGKGDLETKVSDQFLMGSFREFAGDLNALADVAVVAAQKQLKSERMKTELITNVSHDIKTPLTSIINYVDLLQKPHTEEEGEMYLEVLSRQSNQLKKLIEDLMEMSKASTGNMHVDIIALNAAEAVNQALGEFSDKLEKAQLIPVFRQPEEPIYMKADGRLAWRVMSNLLGNAVKYALPGTRLYVDLMELEGKVIISFKNISREELNVSADELLERFVRGDASRNTEGSGLGLNIAQSLMEIQKGQLQILVDGDLFKVTLVFPAVKE